MGRKRHVGAAVVRRAHVARKAQSTPEFLVFIDERGAAAVSIDFLQHQHIGVGGAQHVRDAVQRAQDRGPIDGNSGSSIIEEGLIPSGGVLEVPRDDAEGSLRMVSIVMGQRSRAVAAAARTMAATWGGRGGSGGGGGAATA